MAADLSSLVYFAPIASFLLVLVVTFLVLLHTKIIGDSRWMIGLVSAIVASIFVSAAGVRQYVLTIVPWLAVLLVSLFFLVLLITFLGADPKNPAWMKKGIGVVIVIVAITIFVVSGIKVFYYFLSPYLPLSGDYGYGADPTLLTFTDWLFSPPVLGGLFLVVISGFVMWVLIKAK